ncbi:MAG: glycosyltransferase family 39 protein [Anaerolineae bacterium]
MKRSRRRPYFRLLLAILILAFGLRVYRLDHQSLRGDEAASVLYAALPVSDLWELSRITDPHPPLFYLLLHPWRWLVGESAWGMRFAGVGASVLAVAVLYALARRTLRSTGTSLLAAGLLAVNPLQIWLAQDVRSYPFFTLLGLLSTGALWWALHRKTEDQRPKTQSPAIPSTRAASILHPLRAAFILHAQRSPWLVYTLLTVASLYIHYYTVFLIAFQGLFVLLNARKFWPKRWGWLASQVVIGLGIVPGLVLAFSFIDEAASLTEVLSLPTLLRRTSTALLAGFTLEESRGLVASLLLAPVWLAGLATLLRRNLTAGAFWGLFFAAPVLGVIGLSINRPFFKERFLAQAQPPFEVLLAVGFIALANVWRAGAADNGRQTPTRSFALSGVLLIFLLYFSGVSLANYFTDTAYAKAPPWNFYRDYVSGKDRPNDVVLTNFPEASVSYYSPDELPFYVVPAERGLPPESLQSQTEQIAGAYDRIWFLPLLRQGFDEQGAVLNWLDRHADRVDQVFFPDYHLNLYLSPRSIEALMVRQPVTFANGLALRGYQILDERGDSRLEPSAQGDGVILRLSPGESFTLSLYWTASVHVEAPYTAFTHLIAADGFNRAGQDNPPVWGTYPTTQWQPGETITDKYTLTVPPGTPPGDHRLRLGWYHPDTLARVPVVDGAGQPGQDHAILTALTIRVE